jgi:NADH-quinone oxidoreductase subunit A
MTPIWPFLVYGVAVVLLVTGILCISWFLGERHKEPDTDEVYEAGMPVTGTARVLFPVQFYVVAMFFVIFDVEAFFIMAWAIAIKAVGWAGYIAIALFIMVLSVVLVYEWSIGALNFGPDGKKILKAYRKRISKKVTV